MKTNLILFTLLFLVSCGKQTKQISLEANDGANGKNGHSLVSMYNESSELECSNGGMRLDIYMDLNDNLLADEGDSYSNSLVSCNGENGLRGEVGEMGPQGIGLVGPRGDIGPQGLHGPVGPQGASSASAVITSYTSSNCTAIVNTIYFIKANGQTSGIYTSSSCQSNTKEFELGEGDSIWLANNVLAAKLVNVDGIRTIKF